MAAKTAQYVKERLIN